MKVQTVKELLAALREQVTEDGAVLLDRLMVELDLYFWPTPVFDVAVELFGPQLNNPKSQIRRRLDRRIRHCLRVWQEKYGPLNVDQEKYVSSVLCGAIRSGAEDGDGRRRKLETAIPFVLTNLEKATNHEVVDAGFKRRDGRRDRNAEMVGMLG